MLPVVQDLARRGWKTKARVTGAGKAVGGDAFDKCNLYGLLINPLYVGKIRHKDELYDGEHQPIVTAEMFAKVQAMLQHNGRSGGVAVRNRHGALLKRLLHCKACGKAMVHTFTAKRGRQYRYYTCLKAIKSGWSACPSKSLPAAEIEKVVVEQIRCIGRDPKLVAQVLAEARGGIEAELMALRKERTDLNRELGRHHAAIRNLASGGPGAATAPRLADLHDQVQRAERRSDETDAKVAALEAEQITDSDARAAFADFNNVWGMLSPKEQERLLALLVARVDYDAAASAVAVTFHVTGIKGLSERTLEEAA
jgi:site-specific DNA recombinase